MDARAARGKDGADRRSPGRARFMGVLPILLSLISAAGCYLVFSLWLPPDSARYQDYRAAAAWACSSRAMEQGQTDCLSGPLLEQLAPGDQVTGPPTRQP
ncbi:MULTISPECIES: hypothetical protein [Streptomyces]|nr:MULTISPECIES: hypothetical protein [Streptomyces]